jgi:hypothetical protein
MEARNLLLLCFALVLLSGIAVAQSGVIAHYSVSGSGDTLAFQDDWELSNASIETVDGQQAVVLGDSGEMIVRNVSEDAERINFTLAGEGSVVLDVVASGESGDSLDTLRRAFREEGQHSAGFVFSEPGLESYNFRFSPPSRGGTLAVTEVVFIGDLDEDASGGTDGEPGDETGEEPAGETGFLGGIVNYLQNLLSGIF